MRFALWVLACALAAGAGADEPPGVGDKAPNFRLIGSDGKDYTLAQFRGKSAVIIAWYPRALTPGCTTELTALRVERERIEARGVTLLAASVDPVEANKEFARRYRYDYPLLSDPDRSYARALGVLNPASNLAYRWTYIIDAEGVIRYIDRGVIPGSHGKDLVRRLEALGISKPAEPAKQ